MESNPPDSTEPSKVEEIDDNAPEVLESELQPTSDPEAIAEEISEKREETQANAEERKKMLMDLMEKMQAMGGNSKDPRTKAAMEEFKKYETLYKKHDFWDTQPVPKSSFGFDPSKEGEIEKGKLAEVKQEPYSIPAGYEWSDIDLNDEVQLNEVYELLRDHYVEDSDHMFRFDYQKEFLKWALQPPKQYSDWVCGVRVEKNKKLVGLITGIPVKLRIKGKMIKMTEINFL